MSKINPLHVHSGDYWVLKGAFTLTTRVLTRSHCKPICSEHLLFSTRTSGKKKNKKNKPGGGGRKAVCGYVKQPGVNERDPLMESKKRGCNGTWNRFLPWPLFDLTSDAVNRPGCNGLSTASAASTFPPCEQRDPLPTLTWYAGFQRHPTRAAEAGSWSSRQPRRVAPQNWVGRLRRKQELRGAGVCESGSRGCSVGICWMAGVNRDRRMGRGMRLHIRWDNFKVKNARASGAVA